MCRPDQSALIAQADLVDTLRRCLSPQLHFGAFWEKMCRHVPTVLKGSYAPESACTIIKFYKIKISSLKIKEYVILISSFNDSYLNIEWISEVDLTILVSKNILRWMCLKKMLFRSREPSSYGIRFRSGRPKVRIPVTVVSVMIWRFDEPSIRGVAL